MTHIINHSDKGILTFSGNDKGILTVNSSLIASINVNLNVSLKCAYL